MLLTCHSLAKSILATQHWAFTSLWVANTITLLFFLRWGSSSLTAACTHKFLIALAKGLSSRFSPMTRSQSLDNLPPGTLHWLRQTLIKVVHPRCCSSGILNHRFYQNLLRSKKILWLLWPMPPSPHRCLPWRSGLKRFQNYTLPSKRWQSPVGLGTKKRLPWHDGG